MAGSSSGEEKIRVLLADNDGLIMRIHKNLLENTFSMEVETVVNGMETVCAYQEGLSYDILFLEHKVSVFDGTAVVRTLREMKVESKIVGLYGRSTDEELDAFANAGLDILLQKPLTEDAVKDILHIFNE